MCCHLTFTAKRHSYNYPKSLNYWHPIIWSLSILQMSNRRNFNPLLDLRQTKRKKIPQPRKKKKKYRKWLWSQRLQQRLAWMPLVTPLSILEDTLTLKTSKCKKDVVSFPQILWHEGLYGGKKTPLPNVSFLSRRNMLNKSDTFGRHVFIIRFQHSASRHETVGTQKVTECLLVLSLPLRWHVFTSSSESCWPTETTYFSHWYCPVNDAFPPWALAAAPEGWWKASGVAGKSRPGQFQVGRRLQPVCHTNEKMLHFKKRDIFKHISCVYIYIYIYNYDWPLIFNS